MHQIGVATVAYIAGIIDGEGCIGIRKTKPTGSMKTTRYAATVSVGSTSPEMITFLFSIFGVGSVSYRAGTKRRRACYVWCIQSKNARDLMKLVQPHLLVKRAQAEVLVNFVDGFDSFKGARLGHKGGLRVSQSELSRRARLYARMRSLNRVGPRKGDPRLARGRKGIGVTGRFRAGDVPTLFDRDRLDLVADLDAANDLHA